MVQSHAGIRKNRKALLADLSSFVQTTKGLETALKHASQDGYFEFDMNEMIMKAFRIVDPGSQICRCVGGLPARR